MERKITIRGVGKTTVKPDFVVLLLVIEVKENNYQKSIESATKKVENLKAALEKVGLERDGVKTDSFNVRENYQFYKDRKNLMQRKNDGYICVHRLKIEFDYDNEQLMDVLETITTSFAEPKLDISFTVKDKNEVSEKLLSEVAKNARRKAEVLCNSSGATLGKLLTIDYNWNDINIYARPAHIDNDTCFLSASTTELPSFDIQPKDITINDTAVFVWEIQ